MPATAPEPTVTVLRRPARWLRVLLWFAFVSVAVWVVAYGLRQQIANWTLSWVQQQVAQRYHITLRVDSLAMPGISTLLLRGTSLQRADGSLYAHIDSMQAQLAIWPLFTGRLGLHSLYIHQADAYLALCEQDSARPADTTQAKKIAKAPLNFSGLIARYYNRLRPLLPAHLVVHDLRTQLRGQRGYYEMQVQHSGWGQDSIHIQARLNGQRWQIQGTHGKADQLLQITVSTPDSGLANGPLLREYVKMQAGWRTATLTLRQLEVDEDEVHIAGRASARQLLLLHPRLSKQAIRIDSLRADMALHLTPTSFTLDSASTVSLNAIPIQPYFNIQLGADTSFTLRVATAQLPAQQFLDALPPTLFGSVQGMQAQGRLGYKLHVHYTTAMPDTAVLEAGMDAPGFRITRYGRVLLPRIADEFTHRTYREGRQLVVGPSSADFVHLDEISSYLHDAVLSAEDGYYYHHRGFNMLAFQKAIADNFRKGSFARGGSTITMQLVKNVFLTPDKTLGRKLEEAFLVWLIENQHLVSKERMLEVYFNIIEWGPGVYGIKEAARYYFNTTPGALTLPQSIFLAMIIPRPRAFQYNFDEKGQLKEFTDYYFKLIGGILKGKEKISEAQYETLSRQEVILTGPAKELLKADSTRTEQPLIDHEEVEEDFGALEGEDN